MSDQRRRRFWLIVFVACGSSITILLAVFALQDYIDHFYLPDEIAQGQAPYDRTIRAGGMVAPDSVVHSDDELRVEFQITDLKDSTFLVEYQGILPSLFREGQGTIVIGELGGDGVFRAREVLAKHDENYMPPELQSLTDSHDS